MKITWKNSKKMESQAILNSIDNAKNVSSNGEVSFSSMGLESELAVLLTAINFPRDIDDLHRYRILWLSVAEVSKGGLLSSDKLLDMMNRKLAKDTTTKQHEFHILTSISVGSNFPSGIKKDRHGKIMLLDGEYPEFYQDRDLAIKEARFGEKIHAPPAMLRVRHSYLSRRRRRADDRGRSLPKVRCASCCCHKRCAKAGAGRVF